MPCTNVVNQNRFNNFFFVCLVGDFGLRFLDVGLSAGRGRPGPVGHRLSAEGGTAAGSLQRSHGIHLGAAEILQRKFYPPISVTQMIVAT